MTSLYNMSNEYARLLDVEEYSAEELGKLDTLSLDIKEKAVQVGAYILNRRAEWLAVQAAIDAMEERSDRLFKKIQSLTDYLKDQLVKCNVTAITDHPEFELKIRNNPPKVEVTNKDLVPSEYFVKKESLDLSKTLIKEALDSGKEVPGAQLVRGVSLQIK